MIDKSLFRNPGPIGRDHSGVGLLEGFHTRTPGSTRPEDRPPAFKNIARSELMTTVRERAMDPSKIHQKGSSLCGPASLLYLTGKYSPAKYRHFITTLYQEGRARLGELYIEPGQDCKDFNPTGKLAGADWVGLAGIRDSENTIFDYDEDTDEFAGITLPSTLARWLRQAGFNSILNEANIYFTKGEANLRDAAHLRKMGFEICMLINIAGMNEIPGVKRNPVEQMFSLPNHWVVLTSDIKFNAPHIEFTIFTWGQGAWRVPYGNGTRMKVDEWLQNYYGFVACKP